MILVDTGDGSSSLLEYPPLSTLGIPCQLPSPLNSSTRADVCFYGNGPNHTTLKIGIEVKQLTEFAAALDTGRLQATQLPGLLELYDVRWLLIITGSSRRNPDTGALQTRRRVNGEWQWVDWTTGRGSRGPVQYSYLQRFLTSPSFTSYTDSSGEGIRFDKVYDKREAAAWIGDLYATWSKPWSKHSSMRVLDRSGNQNGLSEHSVKQRLAQSAHLHDPRMRDPGFAQRVRTASSLPHVSYTRAVALATQFESVQEMISPGCTCREDEEEDGRGERAQIEDACWAGVQTVDPESGKKRRLGVSLGKAIGEAVR